jgi:CheY-like chemotaxis protein/HPt (histidine-containing phosphotransfer) domain-containing protein
LDRQPYDLIFMDVMMPEMGGLEATAAIRERQLQPDKHPTYKSPIIIVAMTANAMQGDREKCLAAGMDDYLAKPVRIEDIRTIVERWANTATATASAPESQMAPSAEMPGASSAPIARPPAPAEEPPVEISRLLEFTEGNPENLKELVTLYLKQTGDQITQLRAAIAANSPQEVRRLAHSCAGASATCGMRPMVSMLRELERQGLESKLVRADELCERVTQEFERIRLFLEEHLARELRVAAQN